MTDNVTRTGQPGRLAALWSVLANWRDWNLPVKLAAVTLVPVIFAIVLGAMQIADQIDKASSYRRVDRLVVVNAELRSLIEALQRERTAGVVQLAGRGVDIGPKTADQRAATDAARGDFQRAADRVTLDEHVTAASYDDVGKWLNELPTIRKQVIGSTIDPITAVGRYTDVLDALLRFDKTMAAETIDPRLAATASALYELEMISEQVAYQHALIGAGIVRGGLAGPEAEALRTSAGRLSDSTTDFYAVAGADRRRMYDESVRGTGIAGRNNVVSVVLATRPGTDIPVTAQEWNEASRLTEARLGEVAERLGQQLRDRSAALQDEASDGAGLAAVILLVALVVAIGVMFVVGRHLLSSLSALRRSALEVAEHRLPDAVARIRDRGDDAGPVAVEPVPVTSLDEVGQVARAFDAVQQQALRLATEQAGLRAKYSSVFVNLSRRSQGLVQRQLQLLERLERDEEDADQLATLFQLDHLATRMRRNNENLMVLSGGDVGRRNQKPASLADLLRASVSEIEQYQRVVMLPPPDVQIVGYAVGDLVRLTAELLDNATAFSAPDTQVTIASHEFEDGSLCIAVLDEGIGMSQAELDEANSKLADSGSIDVSTSRRMGLFVIGRLASRHGIEVRLNGGQEVTGVRATVNVPADVVFSTDAPVAEPPAAPPTVSSTNGHTNGHTNGSAVNGTNGVSGLVNGLTPAPLPRRNPPEVSRRPSSSTPSTPDAPERLPRRSPGTRLPGPPAAETPATDDLFTPTGDTGWWIATGPGRPVDTRALDETTPIFDEMISAWFRAVTDPSQPSQPTPPTPPSPSPRPKSPASGPAPQQSSPDRSAGSSAGRSSGTAPEQSADMSSEGRSEVRSPKAQANERPDAGSEGSAEERSAAPEDSWQFAADSGFDTARAVSRAEPENFTENGLPRRSAGQNLVPGSAGDTASASSRPGRSARDMRDRLSNYRHGIRRARDHRKGVEPSAQPVARPGSQPGQGDEQEPDAATAQPGSATAPQPTSSPTASLDTGRAPGSGPASDSGRTPRPGPDTAAHPDSAPASQPGSGAAPRFDSGRASGSGPEAALDSGRAADSGPAASLDSGRLSQSGSGSADQPTFGPASQSGSGPAARFDSGRASGSGPAAGLDSGRAAQPGSAQPTQPAPQPGNGAGNQSGPAPANQPPTFQPANQPGSAPTFQSASQADSAPVNQNGSASASQPGPGSTNQAGSGVPANKNGSRAASYFGSGLMFQSGEGSAIPPGSGQANQTGGGQAGQNGSAQAGQSGPMPVAPANGTPLLPPGPAQSNLAHPGANQSNPAQPGAAQTPASQDPARLDLSGAGWRFAADVGWRAANAVSTSTPVDFTSGGLPRRTAGQNLVPGGVKPAATPAGATQTGPLRMDRAEELRGRLGSFQKGLSRGRRSLAERGTERGSERGTERGTPNGYPENKQQESE